jgi:putative ABC transport system substrate-binding protein
MAKRRRQLLQGSLGLVVLSFVAGCGPMPLQFRAARVRRLGFLASSPPGSGNWWPPFQQGLRDLGYVEGENLQIDYRFASTDQLAGPAAELVRQQPEVIAVPSSTDARVARAATSTIPIVCAGNGDLVTAGLVASQARPGGNVTGLSTPLLAGKQLQVLKESAPTVSRVAALYTVGILDLNRLRGQYDAAARDLGLDLQFFGVAGAEDLEPAVEAAVRGGATALYVLLGPALTSNQERIAELAIRHQLPSIWQDTAAVARGGLLTYAPDRADLARRAAGYVDQILRGASPADLPIQFPTQFDFVVNLQTARALGITVPQSVLQQATEVIQ